MFFHSFMKRAIFIEILIISSLLQVLNLEWSSGIDSLRCISRVDLNLNGSFADMILIPSAGATEHNSTAALFILTNPGQLHVYDGAMLPVLKSNEGKHHVQAEKFPIVIPTIDPYITVTKVCLLPPGRDSSKDLLKVVIFQLILTSLKSNLELSLHNLFSQEWRVSLSFPPILSCPYRKLVMSKIRQQLPYLLEQGGLSQVESPVNHIMK